MPFTPPDRTQPEANPTSPANREYEPATWKPQGAGGGAPKISGGVTKSKGPGGGSAPRAFNRPSQVYALTTGELIARRTARATAELPNSAVVRGPGDSFLVTGPEFNTYTVNGSGAFCTCPDRLRLDNSRQPGVQCKHQIMVLLTIEAYGGEDNVPWSAQRLAAEIGIGLSTAMAHCHSGDCPAYQSNNCWIIDATDATAFVTEYTSRMISPGEPDLDHLFQGAP